MGDRSGILAPLFSNFRVIAREIPPTPLYERGARREVYPLLGNQIGQPGHDVVG